MAYEIRVFKTERDDGLAQAIRTNASIAYVVLAAPAPISDEVKKSAYNHLEAAESDFDLYYIRDLLVSTGWNKNTDIFDKGEVWAARHTPEHKPFNLEHNQTKIIGHICSSRAVDESMNHLDEEMAVDDLPDRFHVLNGSVLYRAWSDEEQQKLMEQTIAEIEKGEWYVSMECLFNGFDYGVISPDGSQRVIARNSESAFLTKHLRQYGGTGVYLDSTTGSEYQIGRVLRNITFSGKGLVRKPANPDSIIFNSVASFVSTPADLGYITTGAVATSEEKQEMPEVNPEIQNLQKQIDNLTKKNEELVAENAGLKAKGSEEVITSLRKDVADRDTKIEQLNTQVTTLTESHAEVVKRAETAEASLKTATDQLTALAAAETKRSRVATLVEKGAKPEVAATLADKFVLLDDAAFASTVDVLAEGWKVAEQPKPTVEQEREAMNQATVEPDAALATADENIQQVARAKTSTFFSGLLSGTAKNKE